MVDWEEAEELAIAIKSINEMGEPLDGAIVTFVGMGGEEFFVNLKNVAMIKFPLMKVEDAIVVEQEDF